MKKWRIQKILKTIWIIFGLLFMIWNWTTFQSRHLPKGTFSNSNLVTILETSDQITFRSDTGHNQLEVLFFQGALADPKAYGPLCRKLAENGFTCHLIKMAWRLPVHDYHKITGMFDLRQGKYVLGGHSQGGKIAAQFVYENPHLLKGLFLLGTSHPRELDLSNQDIPCLKIYAEKDGLASVREVMENQRMLPANSKLVLLRGGNHSQFGYLGKLLMDDSPTISLEEQQRQTVQELLVFLKDIENTL